MAQDDDYRVTIVTQPDDSNFDPIYQAYYECFPDSESKDLKQEYLARNTASGEHQLLWLGLRKGDDPTIIAGAELVIFRNNDGRILTENRSITNSGTSHLMYVFVDPEQRGKGLLGRMLHEIDNYTGQYLKTKNDDIMLFAEQDSPVKMTLREYYEDTVMSGAYPIGRRIAFEKNGFNTMDLDLILPPLSENDHYHKSYDMVVRGVEKPIPHLVLKQHMKNYIQHCHPPGTDPDAPELSPMYQNTDGSASVLPKGQHKLLGKALGDILGHDTKILNSGPSQDHEIQIAQLLAPHPHETHDKPVGLYNQAAQDAANQFYSGVANFDASAMIQNWRQKQKRYDSVGVSQTRQRQQ